MEIKKIGVFDADKEAEKFFEIDTKHFDKVEKFKIKGRITKEDGEKLSDREIFIPSSQSNEVKFGYRYIENFKKKMKENENIEEEIPPEFVSKEHMEESRAISHEIEPEFARRNNL